MGCEHGLISLFSQFFLGCFMDFDRYQVCTEGVLLCPTGWVRYRACSESEILSQYAGQIHMIRRMLHCSDQDFNVFALPLIKVMIRYCMVLPASESHHDSEVAGLVRHNLQVALKALEFLGMCDIAHGYNSVCFTELKERQQDLQETAELLKSKKGNGVDSADSVGTTSDGSSDDAATAAGADAKLAAFARISGSDQEQQKDISPNAPNLEGLDTLGRCLAQIDLNKALSSADDLNQAQQRVLNIVKLWRQQLNNELQTSFSHDQLTFVVEVLVLYCCLAHDLGKLLYDLEVVSDNGQRYSPYTETLAQFCERQQSSFLFVRHVPHRQHFHSMVGRADGLILLSFFCPDCLNLFAPVSTLGALILEPDNALNKLISYADGAAAAQYYQTQPLNMINMPVYLNALAQRLVEARVADGVEPNGEESDLFCTSSEVVIQSQSRAWALLNFWVNEMEFGNLESHIFSSGELLQKNFSLGNVSSVLRQKEMVTRFFLVSSPEMAIFVRGIDLQLAAIKFESKIRITQVALRTPLLQRAMRAIVEALFYQRNGAPDAATDPASDSKDPASTDASAKIAEYESDAALATKVAYSDIRASLYADEDCPLIPWQNVEFVDMAMPQLDAVLKQKTSLKDLQQEQCANWASFLEIMPTKIALIPEDTAAVDLKARLYVYFAAQDQDFRDFCQKRKNQRSNLQHAQEGEVASFATKAAKAAKEH